MNLLAQYPALATLGVVWCVLVLKMLAVGMWTSRHRIRAKRFATPEDTLLIAGATTDRHPDVERARRAHRNDLENVLPFFGVALCFALTRPSATAATIYFWGFAAARIAHSIFYLRGTQPHRTAAYTVGWVLTLAMTLQTLSRLA